MAETRGATHWTNRVGVKGAVLGEYCDDIAAYAAAQLQADAIGESVLTLRVDEAGRILPGQEGVWADPIEVRS